MNNDSTSLQSRWQRTPPNGATYTVPSVTLPSDESESRVNDVLSANHTIPLLRAPLPDNVELKGSLWSDLRWWLPDIFGALVAAASLVCTVIVLRTYQGRNLQDVHLPYHLNLTSVIAILATISRAALTLPLSSVLSQEYWLWLSSASKSLKSHPTLMDLVYSESASRGAFGSLCFIYKTKRR